MNPLVIDAFGARLSVSRSCLVLGSKYDGEMLRIQPRQIEYDSLVFLTHNGAISLEALTWLSWHKVPVFIIDWRGRLQTTITHEQSNDGTLRLAQYQAACDAAKRREVGLALIREKVRQSENVLRELSRFYPCKALSFEVKTLDDEGRVSVAYFGELAKVCGEFGVLPAAPD